MEQAFDMHSLEFRLPDLGEGLTEAGIVRWLVEVGDVVAVDQPVVEVETAKAMVEVPCPYGGVVTARFGEEGTELPVGAPLLTVAVDRPGEGGTAGSGGAARGGRTAEHAEAPAGAAEHGGRAQGAPRDAAAGPRAADESTQGGAGGDRSTRNGTVRGAAGARPAAGSGARPPGGPGREASPPASSTAGGDGRRAARPGPQQGGAGGASQPAAAEEGSGNVLVGYGTAAAPARRRRVRQSDLTAARGPVPVISPLVRRLAREHGLDLRELAGSGPDGLIMRADVEYAVRAAARAQAAPGTAALSLTGGPGSRTAVPAETTGRATAAAPAEAPAPGTAPAPGGPTVRGSAAGAGQAAGAARAESRAGVRVPLRGVRGAVAEKMARSRREIPEATCWVDADATELLAARAAMNAVQGPKISVLALFARICTAGLARYPELNSTVDTEAREIVRFEEVHLGFAAQTDRGLVVPVVRDAHTRDAESLSGELGRLTGAARAGTLTPGELTGGTFTLNNYGVFGVDGSTPIINHPEAAMLGIGRIAAKPWVHQGELAVRQVVQLSLTFDHRVCDGGTASGFLRFVTDCVEQPAVLLRSL
ncbi:hypothetical protein GCM10018793_04550 [Streptomyces sulfonofaciens]|uniref:Dihydrolipoamide acetyltransferase component of pyruvate dehydrogenase complex n=1 Tax=Streptomyces sulfonofaciens TaxID=68272 RepID=A0A919FQ85_9ACTN|nr:dihydrolipoamide acetyltransferase family protein [Streptomyces sulfonofaciens]GHH70461.1 hypothetical protein GCM10018793_04550 [Streptomyces sulfonofaciens]